MATAKNKTKTETTTATAPVVTLADIVAAGAAGLFTSAAAHGELVSQGLVEVNPAMTNEAGEIATRATQAGIDSINGAQTQTATTETAAPAAVSTKPSFKIASAVPIPETVRSNSHAGNARASVYPFDELEVGQAFFVAATEKKPEPAKSLASTVSSATARFAVPSEDGATRQNRKGNTVPVTVETRKFIVKAVEDGAIFGEEFAGQKGAGVWRTK